MKHFKLWKVKVVVVFVFLVSMPAMAADAPDISPLQEKKTSLQELEDKMRKEIGSAAMDQLKKVMAERSKKVMKEIADRKLRRKAFLKFPIDIKVDAKIKKNYTFLEERKKRIKELIEIVDPASKKKYSRDNRSSAAYLLGELRAVEAVPVLAKSLSTANNPQRLFSYDVSPYDNPIPGALIKIGRPAVLAMIQNMETSDDLSVRMNSKLVLYYTVGGNRRVLEILKRRLNEAEDPKIKTRLKRACDKLADDISKFKPDKDYKRPLY